MNEHEKDYLYNFSQLFIGYLVEEYKIINEKKYQNYIEKNNNKPPKINYIIDSRDSLNHLVYDEVIQINKNNRKYTKHKWYFKHFEKLFYLGIVTYNNLFTVNEIKMIEKLFKSLFNKYKNIDINKNYIGTLLKSLEFEKLKSFLVEFKKSIKDDENANGIMNYLVNDFLQKKFLHPHSIQSTKSVRSKLFFAFRYLWYSQLKEKNSRIGEGIRSDVDAIPVELIDKIIHPLEKHDILPINNLFNKLFCNYLNNNNNNKSFNLFSNSLNNSKTNSCNKNLNNIYNYNTNEKWYNQISLNWYITGTKGISPHFDNKSRFEPPIISIRLFSESRLCFGCRPRFGGYSEFMIPLPVGCVCILEKNGIGTLLTHCVNSSDMYGESGSIIVRRIHDNLLNEVKSYHINENNEQIERLINNFKNNKKTIQVFLQNIGYSD